MIKKDNFKQILLSRNFMDTLNVLNNREKGDYLCVLGSSNLKRITWMGSGKVFSRLQPTGVLPTEVNLVLVHMYIVDHKDTKGSSFVL